MDSLQIALDPELLKLFLEEANEHLQALNTDLMELERNPTELEVRMRSVLRAAHSIKGAAATVGSASGRPWLAAAKILATASFQPRRYASFSNRRMTSRMSSLSAMA